MNNVSSNMQAHQHGSPDSIKTAHGYETREERKFRIKLPPHNHKKTNMIVQTVFQSHQPCAQCLSTPYHWVGIPESQGDDRPLWKPLPLFTRWYGLLFQPQAPHRALSNSTALLLHSDVSGQAFEQKTGKPAIT